MVAEKRYEARMYGIGYSKHASLAAARKALAKFRRAYRETRQPTPYPYQTIVLDGRLIYGKW
jgi:hypothetical protein